MNASAKTVRIADGIAKWAAVQNLAGNDRTAEARMIRMDWSVWCDDNPQFVEFAQAEQYALFDRVNARF